MALALIVINFLASLALAAAILGGLVSAHGILGIEVDPRTHVLLALFAAIMLLFGHSMTMFYFIGTGIRMKELVAEHGVTEDLISPTVRFKARVFPFATMAMLVTMVAFIIGGGVDTGRHPSWVHLVVALMAFVLHSIAVQKELRAIHANVLLFEHLDAIVVAKTAEAGGAA